MFKVGDKVFVNLCGEIDEVKIIGVCAKEFGKGNYYEVLREHYTSLESEKTLFRTKQDLAKHEISMLQGEIGCLENAMEGWEAYL